MTRDEIMKAAGLAAKGWGNADHVQIEKGRLALICAAELLKQVEVLPEGAEAQKGDTIDLGDFGFAIVTEVSGNNIDCAMLRDGQLMSGYFFRNFGKYPIIQRAGKPVITVKGV